ncbi:molybdopterin molybdenumtransferase MoeA [Methylopila jiangsuensis]|uniref:Molybdopterin molybdenumtransferase n=1 Tax=Methylopila jiangsuensis TaxID=586230 RepID=A0A9W6JGD2_9HYPH|nr:gephyrin-like molybdotransferase Glp [Methylopila jiangsuensis]MDR6285577.1 molybdopterin molybdotransferase [Methylopila jiangsuensis]GLK75335.1 molybdopterin molybdenumtransferase MoeA [Methylopila jiangsuensis]
MSGLLPVAEARARILAGLDALPAETVPLSQALGRTLAAPLDALRTQPPWDCSAMDGYAVRAADATAPGARLTVIGEAAAGRAFAGEVDAGQAARIFTGAPVPRGADAILLQEDVDRDGDLVVAREAAQLGRHIRAAGLDFRHGETLLPAGHRLGARDLALGAALGHAALTVTRRPRVALLATGDELVPPGAPVGPDQIVASNSFAIAGAVRAEGGEAIDLGIARDDRADLAAALERAFAAKPDILITLGGASVGDHDLVQPTLLEAGVTFDFWKIAMRPGKPMMAGRRGATLVLGLPGNPVSSIVCALLFLAPALRKLSGRAEAAPRPRPARLGRDMPANDHREDYMRAALHVGDDGVTVATAFPRQDSSMLRPLAEAEGLLIRAPNAPAARAGDPCLVLELAHPL